VRWPWNKVIDAIETDGAKTRALITQMMGAAKSGTEAIEMDLDGILAKVTAQTSVIQSNNTLLAELSAEIKANANDPAKMQAIADAIDGNTASISAAVVANTPAAPAAS
jgi:hypothetical protein